MTAVTLEQIQGEHDRIGALIEKFKTQSIPTEYRVDAATIPLAAGERLAGPIFKEDGSLDYYLIKLPGEGTDLEWDAAQEYAASRGALLPTLRELALMRTNLRDAFVSEAYRSGEQYEGNSAYAWYQYFLYGYQGNGHKSAALRAVAVRRFVPSVI
ncbi:DUF1566 domain-containing protein [Paraburkholderia tropica]|uniref:DUF1566 domain-containing protein n=1 Tax=Paraburkholderia tropica TaxID=92647 RepID=UPI001F2688A8|nr:DUF1566 domain-containing protein [Paraburkholderia tropica]